MIIRCSKGGCDGYSDRDQFPPMIYCPQAPPNTLMVLNAAVVEAAAELCPLMKQVTSGMEN